MSHWLRAGLGALFFFALFAWWLSRPLPLDDGTMPEHVPDSSNGELLFHAGGCASCHGELTAEGHSQSRMAGGRELASPYGVFVVPNISPDPEAGIGEWSGLDFANAMLRGVSPDGRHYYPAFPYTSYTRMSLPDLLDLRAYLDRLPAVSTPKVQHRLKFPYGFRRPLGLWKKLFLDDRAVKTFGTSDPVLMRGRYLVEGPGHCGECHTPRNVFGGLRLDQWLAGAPVLEGEGRAPDITAAGLSDWSESDLSFFLESGMDPEFDVVGGSMVDVQENMARLPQEDREAIAAYLKASGQP